MIQVMKLTHNDVTVEVPEDTTITDFLTLRKVKHPKYIVLERNGDLVPQESWSTVILQPDDEIETSYLSGGG